MFRKKICFSLLLGLMLTLSLLAQGLAFTAAPNQAVANLTLPTPVPEDLNPNIVVVRAYFSDRKMVDSLMTWTEPWEVDFEKGFAMLAVGQADLNLLRALGFEVVIDEEMTAAIQRREPLEGQVTGIPGYPCYRTVEETYATAQAIVDANPTLASWVDIGDSWEKVAGLGGYDLYVLKLTNSAVSGPKPKIFIMSSMHAREYTPAELNTRFAEYLIDNYSTNADATWLLDYHEIHLLLQANPDGRKQAEIGQLWRKNTNQNYCSPTSTSRGADLNRNYSFQWGCCGGSSSNQCSETYRGPSAGSEPETTAVQNYITSIFPDQRPDPIPSPAPADATGVFIDVHSYSQLVLWPWGFTATPTGNATALTTLGRKFAFFNNYTPYQSINLYITDGTTDDFAYGNLGVASYTFELGTSFFQNCGTFENTILPNNLPALVYAAKAARTPYLTPAGPEPINLAAIPGVVAPGDLVALTATLNDARFNNSQGTEPTQNITAGEYYIDVPPWGSVPVPHPMAPSDGNFDNPVEGALASLDTTGLSNGQHILYVRGRDALDNWGPVSAVFVTIIDPAVAPTIEGYVREAGTNLPLDASVSAFGPFITNTDPATGFYQMRVISGTYDLTASASGHGSQTVTGIVAEDYQTVRQDFSLYPACEAFSETVENGTNGWTAQSPWAITTETAHSPTHSWTDSPGGNYADNRNISLTSPVIDLTGFTDVTLDFWQICTTESGYDYCIVEISPNGSTWTSVYSTDGPHSQWEQISVPVPALDNASTARLRFRFTSDASVVADGWHLDDIQLVGAGQGCVTVVAPEAGFTSSSPDYLGETTAFQSTSTGTNLSYLWNFGDGGTSTGENPSHPYLATGTYTVTLTVSNTLGADVATGQVEILPVVAPMAGFTSSSPDTLGEITTFTNTSTGTAPAYLWAFGDGDTSTGENPSHPYLATGSYTVTLTVSNTSGTDTATGLVEILAPSPAQIAQWKTASLTSTVPGGVLTYTLHLHAALTGTHAYSLTLTDAVPEEFLVLTATLTLDGVPAPSLYGPLSHTVSASLEGVFTDTFDVEVVFQAMAREDLEAGTPVKNTLTSDVFVDGMLSPNPGPASVWVKVIVPVYHAYLPLVLR